MKKRYKSMNKKVHTTPGSLIYTGDKDSDLHISLLKYSKEECNVEIPSDFSKLIFDDNNVNWLRITGLNDTLELNNLVDFLNIHPLVMEDILEVSSMPKMENYDDYLFLVSKNIFFNEENELETTQISFILYENLVISFEENPTATFDNVKRRIIEGSNIRKYGADYLLYSLLDSVVDNYFLLIEHLGNTIDLLEDELLVNPSRNLLDKIYKVKRDIIYIRNVLWPMRNLVSSITRNDHNLIDEKTIYYFRDVYDHIVQVVDLTETSRDICSGMLDTYLSSVGNKTNDIMKVLTIVSTISVPLTFLTGVFGMNFKYFPTLEYRYAYPAFWIITLLIVILMSKFFKKKGWL